MTKHKWTHPKVLALIAQAKPNRLATFTRPVVGTFTRWKAGDVVLARHVRGSSYVIERVKWRKPKLPLVNSCCGVPRAALKFHQ